MLRETCNNISMGSLPSSLINVSKKRLRGRQNLEAEQRGECETGIKHTYHRNVSRVFLVGRYSTTAEVVTVLLYEEKKKTEFAFPESTALYARGAARGGGTSVN